MHKNIISNECYEQSCRNICMDRLKTMTAELFREGIRVADGLDTGIEKNRALSDLILAQTFSGPFQNECEKAFQYLMEMERKKGRKELDYESIFNLADINLSQGDKERAALLAEKAMNLASESGDLHKAINGRMVAMGMHAKMHRASYLPATNFKFLTSRLRRSDEDYPGAAEFFAMALCDCMHLDSTFEKHIPMVERLIDSIRGKNNRDEVSGHVARKLCMRNETKAAESEYLIETAEKLCATLGDPLERIFTQSQIAISKGLNGRTREAIEDLEKVALIGKRRDDMLSHLRDNYLMMAYLALGMSERAEDFRQIAINTFNRIHDSASETLEMSNTALMLGNDGVPEGFGDNLDDYLEQCSAECRSIADLMVLSGRLCGRKDYLADAIGMLRSLDAAPDAFDLQLKIAEAWAFLGDAGKSIDFIQESMDSLHDAGSADAKLIFEEIVSSNMAEIYFYTGGKREIVDIFLEAGTKFCGDGKALRDSRLKFCSMLSSLAKDRKYQLTFVYG